MLPTYLAYTCYIFYLLSFTHNIHILPDYSLADIFMMIFVKGIKSHDPVSCKVFIDSSSKLIGLMMA